MAEIRDLPVQEIREFIQQTVDDKEARTFRGISSIYPFTTENLAGYFPLLNLQGKTVLTVSGSGDHVLNAIYHRAKQIDAFDVNFLSSSYTELKLRAVHSLDYDDFLAFFALVADNQKVLSKRLYNQFSHSLSFSAKHVFDLFYQYFDGRGWALRNSHLFYNQPPVDHQATIYNAYLQNPYNYRQTRKSLSSCSYRWQQSNITEIEQKLKSLTQYDVILLSNIADYAHLMYPGSEHLLEFFQHIIYPLAEHLSREGLICVACLFQIDKQATDKLKNDLYLEGKRREVLSANGLEYQELRFPSAISGNTDALIVLKKAV
jgi:hypothetical protein